MSNLNTSIEWADATWSPVTGCTKVSAGCKNCYAERVFPRTAAGQMVPEETAIPLGVEMRQRVFTDVRCHEDRLDQPLHWKKPRRIFVNSMSDVFHEDVPFDFIDRVFAVMALSQGDWGWHRFGRDYVAEGDSHNARHTFQILTKRPERMRKYMTHWRRMEFIVERTHDFVNLQDFDYDWKWPLPNVWLGISAENQETLLERVPKLIGTPAVVHFISYEPALGPIDLHAIVADDGDGPARDLCWIGSDARIDWVIAGGESGPGARPPQIEWFRSVRDQCIAANVPFFFKQWGEWAPRAVFGERPLSRTRGDMVRVGKKAAGANLDGREWREFPKL